MVNLLIEGEIYLRGAWDIYTLVTPRLAKALIPFG